MPAKKYEKNHRRKLRLEKKIFREKGLVGLIKALPEYKAVRFLEIQNKYDLLKLDEEHNAAKIAEELGLAESTIQKYGNKRKKARI